MLWVHIQHKDLGFSSFWHNQVVSAEPTWFIGPAYMMETKGCYHTIGLCCHNNNNASPSKRIQHSAATYSIWVSVKVKHQGTLNVEIVISDFGVAALFKMASLLGQTTSGWAIVKMSELYRLLKLLVVIAITDLVLQCFSLAFDHTLKFFLCCLKRFIPIWLTWIGNPDSL